MANLLRNLQKIQSEHRKLTNFRYVLRIDELDENQLNEVGMYIGYPCHRGHVIRDQKEHWCYHCMVQLQQNICGLEVNLLHHEYRTRYAKLLQGLKTGGWDECWEFEGKTRTNMPSYRSKWSKQKAEGVQVAKAVYQAFWGDIGTYRVDRACGNKNCYNPLHLISTWSVRHPPQQIFPLDLTLDPEKIMMQANLEARGYDCEALIRSFRKTITHPTEVAPEAPEHEP